MKFPDPRLGPELPRFLIKGVRTDAWTQEEKKVDVLLELKTGILRIIEGGPTGSESMFAKVLVDACESAGWLACMGARQKYDRLFITSPELRKARDFFLPYFDSAESDTIDGAEKPEALKDPEHENNDDDHLKDALHGGVHRE
jgi:hypothetical protein